MTPCASKFIIMEGVLGKKGKADPQTVAKKPAAAPMAPINKNGVILSWHLSGPTVENKPRMELTGVISGQGPKKVHIMSMYKHSWGQRFEADMKAMVAKGQRGKYTKAQMLAMRDSWKS